MLEQFREVWLADFEFATADTLRPVPVCLVAHELHSGRVIRLWRDQFGPVPPYGAGPDTLFVAFFASAELGCHRVLGWPQPACVLDLFTEFRDRFNGLGTLAGNSLLAALTQFGIDGIDAHEKQDMRELVLGGGPWSADQRTAILDYCETDVVALKRLLPAMLPGIDIPRALLRGRYMAAVAAMEQHGVPIDTEMLARVREHWEDIQDDLIAAIDTNYGVYDGRSFKMDRFAHWLSINNIPWPRLESGQLDLDRETFRQQSRAYPAVAPLHELRSSLAELRLNSLAVGSDGRNRTLLSPFRSRTGRNQPSNAKFIFGPSRWIRHLIRPPIGHGLAYIDWSQQEYGIAACLSGDQAMIEACSSGDPYLTFAKQAGLVPPDATKESHKAQREQCKAAVLGIQYGMQSETLAARIGESNLVARELLLAHRTAYRQFWKWSDAVVDHAMLHGSLWTVFGWHLRVGADTNPRMLRNFPMQANGAEMLRLACCLGTERGIEVSAPVHDAVLICAPLERLDHDVTAMRQAMAEASRAVLNGFELKTDAAVVKYPDRYTDPRGASMWQRVCELVEQHERRVA
jgi:DNA polymerase family A